MFVFPPICRLGADDRPSPAKKASGGPLHLREYTRVGKSTEPGAGNGLFAAHAMPAGVYVEHDSLVKVRVDGVEERGQAVIRGVTLRGCVDALGLRMDTAELRQTTVEMACMQYFDMDRKAAMDKSARTEALLLVQMDTQLYPEHEWRFPMYFYGEVNIATAVAFLLVPETREALNALVLSYKVGPGHLDPCFFVQGMSIAELLWVFAIGAHFEATKPAVGFHIVGELVLAIALMLQNNWLHEEDGGAARVACVSRLVCQANTTYRAHNINCGAAPRYSSAAEAAMGGRAMLSGQCTAGSVVRANALVLPTPVPAGAELFLQYDGDNPDPEECYRFVGDVRQTKNGYVWELLQSSCTPGVRRLALAALQHPRMHGVLKITRNWVIMARGKGGLDAGQVETLTEWGLA